MAPPKLRKIRLDPFLVAPITQRRIDALSSYWGMSSGAVLDECLKRVYQRERRKIRGTARTVVDRHHEDD